MTTNPVRPPPPPDPESSKTNKADGKKFREELQKVEKVREIDPDEESRKKNKQLAAQFGDQDAPTDVTAIPVVSPSPFDVNFYKTSSSQESVAKPSSVQSRKVAAPSPTLDATALPTPSPTPVPSPAYSPPPTVQPTASPQPTPASQPLPSSPNFWQSVDTSNNTTSASQQSLSEYTRMPSIRAPSPQNNDDDQDDYENNEYQYQYQPGEESDQNNLPAEKTPQKPSSALDQNNKPQREQTPSGKEKAGGSSNKKQTEQATETNPFAKEIPSSQQQEEKKPSPSSGASTTTTPQEPSEKQTASSASASTAPSPRTDTEAKPFPTTASSTASPNAGAATPPSTFPQSANAAEQQGETTAAQTPAQPLTASTSQKSEAPPPMARPVGEKTAPISSTSDTTAGQDKQDQHDHKGGSQPAAPSMLPQFSPDIQPAVQAAATQAASYLNPDTMALFQQMVGTIYVMNSRPGVSTTEVLLNSPAFAGSKFFGSTITIEKYATAPNALNIRLTGSTEAVNAFNQNLSSLVAAFEHSKFQFTVRIETAYKIDKVDRPVFQRKGKGDEKGSKDPKDSQK